MMERPQFIHSDIALNIMNAGRRSDIYDAEHSVIKIVRKRTSDEEAKTLLQDLQTQYSLFQRYLAPYVLDTQFILGHTDKRSPVVTIVQPKIEGIYLGNLIERVRTTGEEVPLIKDFLQKVLVMHRETGQVPDLFGRIQTLRWYNPLYTRNVIVTREQEEFMPILADTNFSHVSEGRLGPVFHNKLLARGIQRLLQSI